MAIKVAIVGASGYSGAELVRLLSQHPKVKITALAGESSAGEKFEDLYPWAKELFSMTLESLNEEQLAKRAQLVFLALPHTQAMKTAPALLEKGVKVIDLSGDFRLKDPILYEKWYKAPHTAPQVLKEAVYGLPELNRKAITGARLVANPGCYATSIILAMLPLLTEQGTVLSSLIVDTKSGISGAGKKANAALMFSEIHENFSAYKVGGVHQHIPEIEQVLSGVAGKTITLSMTPHYLPVVRGILSTLYVDLSGEGFSAKKLTTLYEKFYQAECFVRIYNGDRLPDLRAVRGTNFCDIGIRVDERTQRAILISCIDNLGKGAASQAVQNMNLMFGLPETMGIESPALAI